MLVIGQLQGLTSLELRFRTQGFMTACGMKAISKLKSLQRLAVDTVVASDVVGTYSLPDSLTYLRIGGCCEDEGLGCGDVLACWAGYVAPGNNIMQLNCHGLCCPSSFEEFDFGRFPALRQLQILLKPPPHGYKVETVLLSESMSKLTALEVLNVGTTVCKYPWSQYSTTFSNQHLMCLSKLQELDAYGIDINYDEPARGQLSQLTRLYLLDFGDFSLPWFRAVELPQLQQLKLELPCVDDAAVQQLASLTQLTCLGLIVGQEFPQPGKQFWVSLEPLALSLRQLLQLNLVTWGAQQEGDVLPLPDISRFDQIKQLQLVRVMDPGFIVPAQPSSVQLLQGLSKLTQLEELQLEGYSTISPALVSGLTGVLPQLRLLQIGLCKHPEIVGSQLGEGAAEQVGDDGDWVIVHPGFSDLQALYGHLRPQLKVKVGYARQWRQQLAD